MGIMYKRLQSKPISKKEKKMKYRILEIFERGWRPRFYVQERHFFLLIIPYWKTIGEFNFRSTAEKCLNDFKKGKAENL